MLLILIPGGLEVSPVLCQRAGHDEGRTYQFHFPATLSSTLHYVLDNSNLCRHCCENLVSTTD